MNPRAPEAYVHGLDGGCVAVPGRVAAFLVHRAGLDAYAIEHRGRLDPEVAAVLMALRIVGKHWRQTHGSATGTTVDGSEEQTPPSALMSTGQAAKRIGVTSRAVRRAIEEKRLDAHLAGKRWLIAADDVEHFRARRAA